MLLTMTKKEHIDWFRKSRYSYPINFDMEIDNTVYFVSSHFNKAANESYRKNIADYFKQAVTIKNIALKRWSLALDMVS